MSGLTDEEREQLANSVAREHGWGDPDGPDIFTVAARIAVGVEARTREAIAVGIEGLLPHALTFGERASILGCANIARKGGAR